MEQLTLLLLLSFSMLFGSYFAGTIPLVFSFSEVNQSSILYLFILYILFILLSNLSIEIFQNKLRLLTIFGSGILVGTALSVIIPEGVNAIYASAHSMITSNCIWK